MVDTVRSLDTLLLLFADNTSGDISPQDLRDMLVSLEHSHGSYNRLVASDTTIVTPGAYVKAAGTTVSHHLHSMDVPEHNRIRYTGASNRYFHVVATISMTATGSNQILGFKIARNGVVLDESAVRVKIGSGADISSVTVHADMDLGTNDYVEIWVTNETTATAVRLEEFHLFASGVIE